MTKNLPRQTEHLIHLKYRPDIDGLRAVAVLSVVAYHAFPEIIHGGFIGVDVFFVISGFLISTIIFHDLDRGTFKFSEFYARRIRRIAPALLLVLGTCLAFGWFALLPLDYKELGKHAAAGAGFVSNFVLWQESGYFDAAAELKPLLHLWSLGIEEQFYIAWPLLIYLLRKLRFDFLLWAIFIAALSFSLNVWNVNLDATGTFYSPVTRFWELLIGSALAYITLYKRDENHGAQRDTQSIIGLLCIGGAVFALDKNNSFPGWLALLPVIGTFLIISAGRDAWLNRTVLSHRAMVWVGLISFPLYLWHWPLLAFARMFEFDATPLNVRMAVVVASIFFAWLTYKIIEKPIRFSSAHGGVIFALCGLMIAVGCIGYATYKNNGLSFRFASNIQAITDFRYDYKIGYRVGTCLLMPDQDKSAFGECASQPKILAAQSTILWGDSHAAHLYPGLKKATAGQFRFIQLTASGCPPILDVDIPDRPHCREINAYVFKKIKSEKPDRIILAGLWNRYNWEAISLTLEKIREVGAKQIYLVGPVPQWRVGLPKSIYSFYRQDIRRRVPQRMNFGLTPGIDALDEKMRQFAAEHNVNYISPMKILCNKEGCLTRVGDDLESLTAWDYGHLTAEGSYFLVSHFPGLTRQQ